MSHSDIYDLIFWALMGYLIAQAFYDPRRKR